MFDISILENEPHGPAEVLDINNASFTHSDVSETNTLMIISWVPEHLTNEKKVSHSPGLSQPPYV
jgi:hypothetical protein